MLKARRQWWASVFQNACVEKARRRRRINWLQNWLERGRDTITKRNTKNQQRILAQLSQQSKIMNVFSSNTAMLLPTSATAFAAAASTTGSGDEDRKLKARKLSSITGIMNETNTTSPDYHGVGYGLGNHKKQRSAMLEGPPVTTVAVPLQHAAHTGRRANCEYSKRTNTTSSLPFIADGFSDQNLLSCLFNFKSSA
jgi:hypothetical protein